MSEEIVVKASEELVSVGEKLTQEQVDEVVAIMTSGGTEWRRKLRRESHCTWYEYTTTEYYAAKALLNVKSAYVDGEIVSEARSAEERGKTTRRVVDPGWI